MTGREVANLQVGLRLLLDSRRLLAEDEVMRRELSGPLQNERNAQTYGPATRDLVRAFQTEHRLDLTGAVDERPPPRSTPSSPSSACSTKTRPSRRGWYPAA
jgi:peptidoglycan hydrolase-like protein with peptidoglycan-binding domain